jgi:hypothetical protein
VIQQEYLKLFSGLVPVVSGTIFGSAKATPDSFIAAAVVDVDLAVPVWFCGFDSCLQITDFHCHAPSGCLKIEVN